MSVSDHEGGYFGNEADIQTSRHENEFFPAGALRFMVPNQKTFTCFAQFRQPEPCIPIRHHHEQSSIVAPERNGSIM
jgi:hypothetical protein